MCLIVYNQSMTHEKWPIAKQHVTWLTQVTLNKIFYKKYSYMSIFWTNTRYRVSGCSQTLTFECVQQFNDDSRRMCQGFTKTCHKSESEWTSFEWGMNPWDDETRMLSVTLQSNNDKYVTWLHRKHDYSEDCTITYRIYRITFTANQSRSSQRLCYNRVLL